MAELRRRQAPNSEELKRFDVVKKGERDVVSNPLFDRLVYPAAGIASLSFFTTGLQGRTVIDTNMETAGQLTSPNEFLATHLWFRFDPGAAVLRTPALGATPSPLINDYAAIERNGAVQFTTLDKWRVRAAPVGLFPPPTRLVTESSVSYSNAAAPDIAQNVNAGFGGAVFKINPSVRLMPNQAFSVTVTFPTLIPLPSGVPGFLSCYLGGLWYRGVQ